LHLLGFRPLRPGLHVRPDNLGAVAALRERMHALGLPQGAAVFQLAGLDAALDGRARGLWAADDLAGVYADHRRRMAASLARLSSLGLADAAAETFVVGGAAIRAILFDPLLPGPLVDEAARVAFVSDVSAYDKAGREVWSRVHRVVMEAA